MEREEYIFGIRPVIEAIEAGKEIDKILVKKDLNGDLVPELLGLVKQYGLIIQRVPVERLNRVTRKNHQGVVAILSAVSYTKLEYVIPDLYERGMLPFIVVLDGITDVRNFGAISRSCECAGVDAIVIPEHNSVSVNGDAIKTSAGALNYLPVCRERNIVNAIKFLKDNGCRIIGASEKSGTNYTKVDYTAPTVIVMGAEDKGIDKEIQSLCDNLVAIPEFGQIHSLNVSVAAGVMMYEVVRQRLNQDIKVI